LAWTYPWNRFPRSTIFSHRCWVSRDGTRWLRIDRPILLDNTGVEILEPKDEERTMPTFTTNRRRFRVSWVSSGQTWVRPEWHFRLWRKDLRRPRVDVGSVGGWSRTAPSLAYGSASAVIFNGEPLSCNRDCMEERTRIHSSAHDPPCAKNCVSTSRGFDR
jgi:hypothetical protein